jgi:hypothetical protein
MNLSSNSPQANPNAEPSAGNSFLAGLRGSAADVTDAPQARGRRKTYTQHLVVVALLVISGGMLYGMRTYGMRSGISFKEVKVEFTGDSTTAKSASYQRIMNDLEQAGKPIQIPGERLKKNPFMLGAAQSPTDPTANSAELQAKKNEELARIQRERHIADVQTSLSTLQLHSVMDGRVPVARVNDETVRVGSKLAEFFTVTAISGRELELESEGQTYVLSMDDLEGPRKKGTPPRKPAKK